MGLICIATSFYCGSFLPSINKNLLIDTDWLYVSYLVLGVFSFTTSIVGLFGEKYLKAVLYILILILIITIIKGAFLEVYTESLEEFFEVSITLDRSFLIYLKTITIVCILNKILTVIFIGVSK